jgi:hypothetical protein
MALLQFCKTAITLEPLPEPRLLLLLNVSLFLHNCLLKSDSFLAALGIVKESPHLCYEILPKIFDDLNQNATEMEKRLELVISLASRF